jgi:protein TonB
MSTDVLPRWFVQTDIDSPWRRVYWTLPSALLICAIVFIWFTYSMVHSSTRPPEPEPVDAELIEMPPEVKSQPRPVQKPTEQPKIKQAKPTPEPAVQQQAPVEKSVAPPPVAQPIVPPQQENRGAQAIVQPLPAIPDELREEALNAAATARFHIAVDGSTTVELVKPTQNPRLNRLLLDALKHWKFFPAMKDGKPVSSEEVLVIRVLVH